MSCDHTDADLIRSSLATPRAFAGLFERHARDVGRFAARAVGLDAAEDILSETFLVAFRRRSSFDLTWDDARPWLMGIAANLVNKHRGAVATQWRAYAASIAAHDQQSTDGSLDAAADRADADAALKLLAPAIARLSAKDRDTLLLYAWGDLTYEEIGRALRVPTGTVRSRLNRVRRLLAAASPDVPTAEEEGEIDGHLGSRTTIR